MVKIATYGSLKQGFYNHARFGLGEPLAKSKVKGEMYLAYSYPHLYREEVSNKDKVREHDVEIYEIEEPVFNRIVGMELGAGYQVFNTRLADEALNEHDVVIFYTRDDYNYKPVDKFLEAYNAQTVPQALSN